MTPFKSVHAATRKTLLKVKGFSEVKVEKIKEAIAKLQVCPSFSSISATRSAVARNDANHTSQPSLQHPASLQPLSSVIIGREYARSRPEASSLILFSEGGSTRSLALGSQPLTVCQWIPKHEHQRGMAGTSKATLLPAALILFSSRFMANSVSITCDE